jgi:hypothetical protein
MSPSELEKVYRAILFLKEEFFDAGEGRYYTDSWTQAEREATEAHQQGKLKGYESVDEMMDDILLSDNSE